MWGCVRTALANSRRWLLRKGESYVPVDRAKEDGIRESETLRAGCSWLVRPGSADSNVNELLYPL